MEEWKGFKAPTEEGMETLTWEMEENIRN